MPACAEDTSQPRYPENEFAYVEADFSLDACRPYRKSGYRPLWRIPRAGQEPLYVGMNEMTVVDGERVEGGSTALTRWRFWPGVQGYVEPVLAPNATFEIWDRGTRVGDVRILRIVREPGSQYRGY